MAGAAGTLTRSGTFVWEELITSDIAAAKEFYGAVLGWTFDDQPVDESGSYTMWQAGDVTVGGGWQMTDVPSNWGTYIGVDSADTAAAKAQEFGATIIREPFDVMGFGRMATLQDPAGAIVSVWQAIGDEGTAPARANGTVEWRETRSRDFDATRAFYESWLGWQFEARDMGDMTYYVITNGGEQVGGAMQIPPSMGDMPSHWGITFNVDDVDAAFERAIAAGGTEMMPPDDIPNVGRWAGIADPQGAAFGIMKPVYD